MITPMTLSCQGRTTGEGFHRVKTQMNSSYLQAALPTLRTEVETPTMFLQVDLMKEQYRWFFLADQDAQQVKLIIAPDPNESQSYIYAYMQVTPPVSEECRIHSKCDILKGSIQMNLNHSWLSLPRGPLGLGCFLKGGDEMMKEPRCKARHRRTPHLFETVC